MIDQIAAVEAEKYTAAYAVPDYRARCHGLEMWKQHRHLCPDQIESAIDLGCGTGRLVKTWVDEGIDGYGVDLVPEASVDPPIWASMPHRFVSDSLWDFQPGREFDLGMCVDVMEHIPEDQVYLTLSRIAACCRWVVFKIAHYPSSCAGHTLHVTLRDPAWWNSQIWIAMRGNVTPVTIPHPREISVFRWRRN